MDVLVNNAGLSHSGAALREAPETYRRAVGVNLDGVYWMARSSAAHMPPGSSVVNVASVHGLSASLFPQAAYAANKAAVIGLTRDLAQQWGGRRGIRVNAFRPGYFASEMTEAERGELLQQMVAEHSILARFGDQHELDAALLFLASDASSYVVGTTHVVDGGLTATI